MVAIYINKGSALRCFLSLSLSASLVPFKQIFRSPAFLFLTLALTESYSKSELDLFDEHFCVILSSFDESSLLHEIMHLLFAGFPLDPVFFLSCSYLNVLLLFLLSSLYSALSVHSARLKFSGTIFYLYISISSSNCFASPHRLLHLMHASFWLCFRTAPRKFSMQTSLPFQHSRIWNTIN